MKYSSAAPSVWRVRAPVLATLRLTLSAAVIACVAACSDNGQASSITSPVPSGPRFAQAWSMDHAGLIRACVSASSPTGVYTYTSTEVTTHRAGDIVTSPAAINHSSGSLDCATLFNRPDAPSPIDPQATLSILKSGPAGQIVTVSCVVDSQDMFNVCADPATASANINHGTIVTYDFSLANKCAVSSGWYSNQGATAVAAKGLFFGTGATWTTVLDTNPKGNAYYILSKQYIAAKLNVETNGGAPPSSVQAALTGAEAFFTGRALGNTAGVAKNTLTGWGSTLESFNTGGVGGWPHCS